MNIPNCSNIKGFNNRLGTCWNIAVQTILFYNDENREQIFKKILIEGTNYREHATKLVEDARCGIINLFPIQFGPNHFIDKKHHIIKLFEILIRRFNTKYKDDEHLINLYNISDDEVSYKGPLTLKKEKSIICEENFTLQFFYIFNFDYTNFGGNNTATFFLLNLLSIVLLNKYYYLKTEKVNGLTFTEDFIGIDIAVDVEGQGGHAVGIFKCKTKKFNILGAKGKQVREVKYSYVDNNYINAFDFEDFKARYEAINQSRKPITIYYRGSLPMQGIHVYDQQFLDSMMVPTDGEVSYFRKIIEYTDDPIAFKSDIKVRDMYSEQYIAFIETPKLFDAIRSNNISEINRIYQANTKVISDDFRDENGNTVFDIIDINNVILLNILISNIKDFTKVLNKMYRKYKEEQNDKYKKIIIEIINYALSKYMKIDTSIVQNEPEITRYIIKVSPPKHGDSWDTPQSIVPKTIVPKTIAKFPAEFDSWEDDERKYLKYKQKYLNLKNKLFHL